MNEEDLYEQIKVIEATLVYHWRSGDGNRMCGNTGSTPVITLKEARARNLTVCRRCQRVVDAMAKGWNVDD